MRRVVTLGCGAALACLLVGTAAATTPCIDVEALFTPTIVGRYGDGLVVRDIAVDPESSNAWVLFDGGMLACLDLWYPAVPVLTSVTRVDPGADHVAVVSGVLGVAEPGGRVRLMRPVGAGPIDVGTVTLPASVRDLGGGAGILAACGEAGLYRLDAPDSTGVAVATDSVSLGSAVVAVTGESGVCYAATAGGTLARWNVYAGAFGRLDTFSMPGSPHALDCTTEPDPDGLGDLRIVACALGERGVRTYRNSFYLTGLAARDDSQFCSAAVFLPGLLVTADAAGTVTVFSRMARYSLGLGSQLTTEPVRALARCRDLLLLGTAGRGLAIARIPAVSAPAEPRITVPGGATAIAVDGSVAATVGEVVGEYLRLWDLTPDIPQLWSSVRLAVAPADVALVGERVLIAARDDGLLIFDVRNPAAPYPLAEFDLGIYASRVAVLGDVALVLGGNRLVAVDVSDPAAPAVTATCVLDGAALDFAIIGTWAYVALSGARLQIFNVASPAAPGSVGTMTPPGMGSRIAGAGRWLLSMTSLILTAYDLSDPLHPVATSTVTSPLDLTYGRAVAVAPPTVWWAMSYGRLIRLTLGPDGRLEPLALITDESFNADIALAEDRLLVVDYNSLHALPVPCSSLRAPAPVLQGLEGGTGFILMWDQPAGTMVETCLFRDGDSDPTDETPLACGAINFFVDPGTEPHTYRVITRDSWGRWSWPSNAVTRKSQASPVPDAALVDLAAAPNPFNPRTTLHFTVPQAGRVHLAIHDLTGRRVTVLVDQELPAGPHAIPWTGRDARGHEVSSGLYLARLVTEQGTALTRLTLLR